MRHFRTGGGRSSTQGMRTGQRLDIHLLHPILVRFARAVPARDDAAIAVAFVSNDLPDAEARPAASPPRHPAGYCGEQLLRSRATRMSPACQP